MPHTPETLTEADEALIEEFFERQNEIWKSETGFSIAQCKEEEKELLRTILTKKNAEKEAYAAENVREEGERYEPLVAFVASFKKRAWDAWKPVQLFRSDRQVEDDELRKDMLDALNDEAQELLQALHPTNEPLTESLNEI